jgi:hypothetical protein
VDRKQSLNKFEEQQLPTKVARTKNERKALDRRRKEKELICKGRNETENRRR